MTGSSLSPEVQFGMSDEPPILNVKGLLFFVLSTGERYIKNVNAFISYIRRLIEAHFFIKCAMRCSKKCAWFKICLLVVTFKYCLLTITYEELLL